MHCSSTVDSQQQPHIVVFQTPSEETLCGRNDCCSANCCSGIIRSTRFRTPYKSGFIYHATVGTGSFFHTRWMHSLLFFIQNVRCEIRLEREDLACFRRSTCPCHNQLGYLRKPYISTRFCRVQGNFPLLPVVSERDVQTRCMHAFILTLYNVVGSIFS